MPLLCRKIITFILIPVIFLVISAYFAPLSFAATVTVDEPSKQLARGVNLSIFPLDSRYNSARNHLIINKSLFAHLHRLGYTHVRLVLPPTDLFTDNDFSDLNTANIKKLDQAIAWASASQIAVVLDIHPYIPTYNTVVSHLDDIWSTLAERYAGNPASLFYEILNEPNVSDAGQWNALHTSVIEVIRRKDRKRPIIVDGLYTGFYTGLDPLRPLPDNNVVYSFHYYQPMAFTHQGLGWNPPFSLLKGVQYPLQPTSIQQLLSVTTDIKALTHLKKDMRNGYNAATIMQDLETSPLQFANRYHVPIYCGEFGVRKEGVNPKDRQQWMIDVAQANANAGIGYAAFSYGGSGFGFSDEVLTLLGKIQPQK